MDECKPLGGGGGKPPVLATPQDTAKMLAEHGQPGVRAPAAAAAVVGEDTGTPDITDSTGALHGAGNHVMDGLAADELTAEASSGEAGSGARPGAGVGDGDVGENPGGGGGGGGGAAGGAGGGVVVIDE